MFSNVVLVSVVQHSEPVIRIHDIYSQCVWNGLPRSH